MSEAETVKPQQPRNATPEVSNAALQQSQSDDKSIWDWMQEMGGAAGELRIKVDRKYPREWQGHHIAGYLDEFDEPFSEADIKQRFGGGKFQVKIQRRSPKGGGWVFAGAKTFEIEGDPRLSGALLTDHPPTPAAGALKPTTDDATEKAMDHMARSAELHQRRAWQLEDERRKGDNGLTPELLKLVTDNPQVRVMAQEMAELRRQAAEKDQRILELITNMNKAPTTPSVIEKTFEHLVAGESHRIEALRTQFDSELRTIRENNRHDVDRERDRLKTELDSRERSHEREIASLREAHGQALKSIEQSYEARIEGYKRREHDLERQLTEARAEVTKLRDLKDKGPLDLVEEVAKMKNALEVLSPEQEPTSTAERIFQGLMQSPVVQAVASRVENAPAAPPPAAPNVDQMRRRRAAAAAARAGQAPPQGSNPEAAVIPLRKPRAPRPHVIELNPVEVAAAISFMEQSIVNGTDPRQFAESARSMVPKQVMMALRAQGVDAFLNSTAQLQDGSPLATQSGRNWARKVARWLLEGTTEEPTAPPAETVEEPPSAS
jgi:hypothetical protein